MAHVSLEAYVLMFCKEGRRLEVYVLMFESSQTFVQYFFKCKDGRRCSMVNILHAFHCSSLSSMVPSLLACQPVI